MRSLILNQCNTIYPQLDMPIHRLNSNSYYDPLAKRFVVDCTR